MKNLRKFLFVLAALAAVFTFASCSDDDDDDDDDGDSGKATITLPDSVGTDELSGTKWEQKSESYSRIFEFAGGTATFTETDSEESSKKVYTYTYTYDSEKKLVYLALTSYSGKEDEESYSFSASSYESQIKDTGVSGDMLSYEIEWCKNLFATQTIYKYTIEDNKLTLAEYFDGTLPTKAYFYGNDDLSYNGYLQLEDKDNDADYAIFPTSSSEDSFSGNLYKKGYDDEKWEKVGTVNVTYTVSGSGTSDSKITFTFTSLPDDFSAITKNTAYELVQDEDSDEYTKVTN